MFSKFTNLGMKQCFPLSNISRTMLLVSISSFMLKKTAIPRLDAYFGCANTCFVTSFDCLVLSLHCSCFKAIFIRVRSAAFAANLSMLSADDIFLLKQNNLGFGNQVIQSKQIRNSIGKTRTWKNRKTNNLNSRQLISLIINEDNSNHLFNRKLYEKSCIILVQNI